MNSAFLARNPRVLNAALALLALVIFAIVSGVTGRISVLDGLGWDGVDYAAMVTEGWDRGNANTALRPLIILLNTPAVSLMGSLIAGFQAMNYAYVVLLALGLCLLFGHYNKDPIARTFFIANAFLCIAVAKFTAYYPVSIDVGALAVCVLTTYFIVSGRLAPAAVGCVAAVLAREFAIGMVLFGIARGVRQRVPLWKVAATYLPSLILYFGWRAFVAQHFSRINDGQLRTAGDLFANLIFWNDPLFVAFFVYFTITICGGLTLFVVARPAQALGLLHREPEWLVFAGVVVAAAAVGNADIWRYLAYLLPVVTALVAVSAPVVVTRQHVFLGVTIALATLVTQRPFELMDLPQYFRDWFPYYVVKVTVPIEPIPVLWPIWQWRFLLLVGMGWLVAGCPAAPLTRLVVESQAPVRRRRRGIVFVVATLLFLWVAFFRFNTLGDSLGGFDAEHFRHFAYAKQVQAGAQPLRDFLDGGLQGARPSLTYEMSAAAQRYLGNNLRSEAFLTVGGVALGAALTFAAASRIASWPVALVMAMLSALAAPRLYGYPRVLVLAVAALLIVDYSARPSWVRVVLMSAWTAIAFLFRHDYAAYCAVGFIAVLALSHQAEWRRRAARGAVFALLTITLLAPSIWWVHEHGGITEYARNGVEMGRREAVLNEGAWPKPALQGVTSVWMAIDRSENTEAWLYYLFVAVPVVAMAVALRRWIRPGTGSDGHVAALVALGVMTVVVSHFFLRGSLEDRFGDMSPPVAVLGAGLLAASRSRGSSRLVPWFARGIAALVVLLVTFVAVWSLQSAGGQLATAKFLEGPLSIVSRATYISEELVALPEALRISQTHDRMEAADYLHRCTRPSDRVLVIGDVPEVFAFSDRLFAGGRAAFVPGFYASETYARRTIAALETESVPLALADARLTDAMFPLVVSYVRERYADAGTVMINEHSLQVLVRRDATGHPDAASGLPCFG